MAPRDRAASAADCVFCRIVAGNAPVSAVFENARTLAFLDINPVRPGHLLVIPKTHRPQTWHMTDAEFSAVYRVLPTLVRGLASAMRADAVDVLNLNGPAGGQTVYHVHFHLIPIHRREPPIRRTGRGITLHFEQQPAARAALDRLARRIRARLCALRSVDSPSLPLAARLPRRGQGSR